MNQVEQMVQQQFHDELRYECTVCAPPLPLPLLSIGCSRSRQEPLILFFHSDLPARTDAPDTKAAATATAEPRAADEGQGEEGGLHESSTCHGTDAVRRVPKMVLGFSLMRELCTHMDRTKSQPRPDM